MNYTVCFYIGVIGEFITGLVMLVMFFKWNIPKIIGELTGHRAKRAVRKMEEENVLKVKGSMENYKYRQKKR